MQKQNKLKIYLIVLVIPLLVLSFFFVFRNSTEEKKEAKVQKPEEKKEQVTYSRINFFLTDPHKASLAIPDYWEGNYRLKEKEARAEFYFVEGVDKEDLIFSIYYSDKKDISPENIKNILGEKDGVNYFFEKFYQENMTKETYYRIYESLPEVLESFKIN